MSILSCDKYVTIIEWNTDVLTYNFTNLVICYDIKKGSGTHSKQYRKTVVGRGWG